MVELIIVSVCIVFTIIYVLFFEVSPWGWNKKEFVKYIFILEGVSLLICIIENFFLIEDPTIINRPEAGSGSSFEERNLEVEGVIDEDLVIEIPAIKLTDEEIEQKIELAKKEIDETFLGENESLNKIEKNVFMGGSYANGLVMAEWRLDDYKFIYTDGSLKNEKLEESYENYATVLLTCQGETVVYEFPFTIIPIQRSGTDSFIYELQKKISDDLKKNEYSPSANLPLVFENYNLNWKKKRATKGISIFIVGIIVVFGLGIGKVEDEKKKSEIRRDELKLAYSDVLSTLTLLLGSGMSVRKAWEKMLCTSKKRAGPKKVIYEEMEITLNQMKTGKSEISALEEFGTRTKLPCYKKMAGLLSGYIQKGSRDITNQLNNEVVTAFEERKALAKVAGELAGTKLLLPMLMLLGVALIVIIVPAILSFTF